MRRRVWILVLAAPVVAAAVLLISSARGLTASAEQAQASNVEVKIDNFSFGPATLTVAAGTTVTWTNRDDIPHTVVSDDKVFKSLTTVCGMSSRFVHVTVVPAATVSVAGPKLKLSIFTSTFDACACSALAVKPLALLISSTAAATTGAAKTRIHTRLLMTFLPFSVFQLNSSRDGLPALKPAKSPPLRGPAAREHNSHR